MWRNIVMTIEEMNEKMDVGGFTDEAPVVDKPKKAKKQVEQQEPTGIEIPMLPTGITDFLDEIGTEPEVAPDKVESKFKLLKSINVDLNDIKVSKGKSEFAVRKTKETLLALKRTFRVVCCQSSYWADISALRNQEIINLLSSDTDEYTFRKKLSRLLHSHIEETSVGHMNYQTFLDNTSYHDFDTLLFGLYSITFPEETTYTMTCGDPDCGRKFQAPINNNSLVEIRGEREETFAKIDEVINSVKNAKDLADNSLVNTLKRVMLDESKVILDIRIPSLDDYLNQTLSKQKQRDLDDRAATIILSSFIDKLYMPDVDEYERTGELNFIEVTKRQDIIDIIADLGLVDGPQMSKAINEFTAKTRVTYALQGVKCPTCGFKFPNHDIDFLMLLFTQAQTKLMA